MLVGPLPDFPEARVGIRYEPMHDRGILSGLDGELLELPDQNRHIPEHRGRCPQNFRDFFAAALKLTADYDERHDRAHGEDRESDQKDHGRDGLHDLQPGRHHARLPRLEWRSKDAEHCKAGARARNRQCTRPMHAAPSATVYIEGCYGVTGSGHSRLGGLRLRAKRSEPTRSVDQNLE